MAAEYRLLPWLRLYVLQDLDDALPGYPGEDGEWRRAEEEEESQSTGGPDKSIFLTPPPFLTYERKKC